MKSSLESGVIGRYLKNEARVGSTRLGDLHGFPGKGAAGRERKGEGKTQPDSAWCEEVPVAERIFLFTRTSVIFLGWEYWEEVDVEDQK